MLRDLFGRARRSALTLGVALSCAAHCHAAPVVSLSRPSVDFGPVGVGTKSGVQPVFVTNTGDAPLTISALTLGGAQAGDFAVAGTCGPPVTLAPGNQCRIDLTVTIASAVPQLRVGTLNLASNATQASATISMLGVALTDITTGVLPSPPWVDFGNQIAGTAAANRTLTLLNPEGSVTVIEAAVLSGAMPTTSP